MNKKEEIISYKSGKNKTIFYKNNKKFKLVYKNNKIEVTTYYTGVKSNERVKEVVTKIQLGSDILTRTTKYFMNKRICSIIDTNEENTYIQYDNAEGKKIISIVKKLRNDPAQSEEFHQYLYNKDKLEKKIIKYSGKYLKSGIGMRYIDYDDLGNVISDKNNIEYYNDVLNKKHDFIRFELFNEELKKALPNLPGETNDFTYGIKDVKKFLKESINLSLDSGSLLKKKYEPDDIYDLPFKFASAAYNTLAKKGNAYIKMQTPEIFMGIDENEIYTKFDRLSLYQRNHIDLLPINSLIKIKLGNKLFDCVTIGKGWECNVYRISYKNMKPVILKIYHAENIYCSVSLVSFGPSGLYGTMGILREANIAGVKDITTLYYANPIYIPVGFSNNYIEYVGAWQIVEDADNPIPNKEGLNFRDWLISHGLIWNDDKRRNWINGICVDPGYVQVSKTITFLNYGIGEGNINLIYSRYINGETTQQILDFLNKK